MSAPQIARKFSLSQDRLKELLHYDPETGIFTHRTTHDAVTAGAVAGFAHKRGYWQICVDSVTVKAHQAAWFYMTGEWPSDLIDHRDRDKANNRWANLRLATNAENCRNIGMTKRNTSGVLGVGWHKRIGKWQASIRVDRKLISLGYFAGLDDAAHVRREAELKYFGEFAPSQAA
jgi:hypothetical protein